jgi:hypothetical protein
VPRTQRQSPVRTRQPGNEALHGEFRWVKVGPPDFDVIEERPDEYLVTGFTQDGSARLWFAVDKGPLVRYRLNTIRETRQPGLFAIHNTQIRSEFVFTATPDPERSAQLTGRDEFRWVMVDSQDADGVADHPDEYLVTGTTEDGSARLQFAVDKGLLVVRRLSQIAETSKPGLFPVHSAQIRSVSPIAAAPGRERPTRGLRRESGRRPTATAGQGNARATGKD